HISFSRVILALVPLFIFFVVQFMIWPLTWPLAWFVFIPAVVSSAWIGDRLKRAKRRSADTVVHEDISARTQAEEKLRDHEERLRLALRAAGLGVFEWNVSADRAVWENERMYEIFGHTSAD